MVATTNTKALAMGKTTNHDGGTTRKQRCTCSRATNTSHAACVTNMNQPSRQEFCSRSSENNSQLLCTSMRASMKHNLSAVSADAVRLMRRGDTHCLSFPSSVPSASTMPSSSTAPSVGMLPSSAPSSISLPSPEASLDTTQEVVDSGGQP